MQKHIFYPIFIFIIFVSTIKMGFAQTPNLLDSAKFSLQKPDTTNKPKVSVANKTKKTTVFTNTYWQNRPRTATILSLALPGAGQVYNGKWWKVPIVYGVIGGMGYLYKINIDDYESYRAEYIWRDQNNDKAKNYVALNKDAVRLYRDQYLSNAEMAGFGLLLSYLMNAGDAFVDAHLQSFNISDDLSLRLHPRMQTTPSNTPNVGVGVAISWR